MPHIQQFINKIDTLKTAIESVQELIDQHGELYLHPTLNYLKEQKLNTAKKMAEHSKNLEIQYEEITRLSHI